MRRTTSLATAKKRILTKPVKRAKAEVKKTAVHSLSSKFSKMKALKTVKPAVKAKKVSVATMPTLLSSTCEIDKKSVSPIMALPPKCAIQPPANLPIETSEHLAVLEKMYSVPPVAIAPTTIVAGKTCKGLWNFCLSPRASFWLGMFFGVTIMGFLVVTAWTLFSADLVNASILR